MSRRVEHIIEAVFGAIEIGIHLLGRGDRTKIVSIIGANIVATFIVLMPYMGTLGAFLLSLLCGLTFVAILMLVEHFISRPLM